MKGYICVQDGIIEGGHKYIENTVIEDKTGILFCKLPNQIFDFCAPMYGLEFAEIEALDEVHKDDGASYITKKLKIRKKISIAEMCERSVPEFFEAFEFDKKIKKAKENCSGDYGVASADNCGAASAETMARPTRETTVRQLQVAMVRRTRDAGAPPTLDTAEQPMRGITARLMQETGAQQMRGTKVRQMWEVPERQMLANMVRQEQENLVQRMLVIGERQMWRIMAQQMQGCMAWRVQEMVV